jgi:diketogulonate reductase-like aldo/keto reductase
MRYKTINTADGALRMPVLGIGTWEGQWGRDDRSKISSQDQEICFNAIRHALNLGINHIDTAELYGDGLAETIVCAATRGVDRSGLFITSKVSGFHLEHDQVLAAAEASLKRLGTDYIDLYLVHWPNKEVPISETMKAMNELADQGMVKHIGVSNFDLKALRQAQMHSSKKLVADQVEYNLQIRDDGSHCKYVESEIIPYCQDSDMFVMAYRPLALGKLAKPGFPLLDGIADDYNSTPAQIAINWLVSKRNVVTIVRTIDAKHMEENLEALSLSLTETELETLDNDFPVFYPPPKQK